MYTPCVHVCGRGGGGASVVLERPEMELNQPGRDVVSFPPYRPAHELQQRHP